MRASKHLLAIVLIVLTSALFSRWIRTGSKMAFALSIILISFFLFNLIVRNKFSFKPYFLSKWNIISSKVIRDVEFDIPKELIYDKLLEVISETTFTLKYANKVKFEILATSKFSLLSWGENIYIQCIPSNDRTIIRFASIALFQIYTWGKNEDNFNEFLQKLENSLTV